MKTLTGLFAVTLLGAASITQAQINMPNPATPGLSPSTAIQVVAMNDLMIDRFIKRWLHQHYPGWDADPYETMEIGTDRYAVVYVTSANNPGRRLYFKIKSTMRDDDDDGFPDN
jgi:hypothetical protein